MAKTTSPEEQEFYPRLAIKEKYASRALERQIEAGLFERHLLTDKNVSALRTQTSWTMNLQLFITENPFGPVASLIDLPKALSDPVQGHPGGSLSDEVTQLPEELQQVAEAQSNPPLTCLTYPAPTSAIKPSSFSKTACR